MTSTIEIFMQTIDHISVSGDADSILNLYPEPEIWLHTKALLNNPEHNWMYGPALLRIISKSFPRVQDQSALQDILIMALGPNNDSLVFAAAEDVVISNAQSLNDSAVKLYYRKFEEGYLNIDRHGEKFLAEKALEGAVMLPLNRNDNNLLYRAIGLLLNDFPLLPDETEDPSLVVKALKLLGRCYDRRPEATEIIRKIEGCVNVENILVRKEAFFNLGLASLYRAFKAQDLNEIKEALLTASDLFQSALEGENRTDAELFQIISKCFFKLLDTPDIDDTIASIGLAQKILKERLLFIGADSSPLKIEIEVSLVNLLIYLEKWVVQLSRATLWPDLKPPMKILAEVYSVVRRLEPTEGITANAFQVSQNLIMLSQVQSRFIHVQNVISKLEEVLLDPSWRETTSDNEIAFYEIVLEQLRRTPSPKEQAAARLQQIRAAAKKENLWLLKQIDEIQESGLDLDELLLQIIERQIQGTTTNSEILLAYPQAQEIADKFIDYLLPQLAWDQNPSEQYRMKWQYLKHAIREAAGYFYKLYIADRNSELGFLFSKPSGLGKDATEEDLEEHFYKAKKWSDPSVIERQPRNIAPGRPDLTFHYPESVYFPIEVKCENKDISPKNIHERFVAQAQTYAAALNQISFLFVLDTTEKSPGTPIKNFLDYCYVDQKLVENTQIENYVIVMIFPANRLAPSDHSWKRTRTSQKG